MDTAPTLENILTQESPVEQSTVLAKLKEKLNQEPISPLRIVGLDIDGTIYTKRQNTEGLWIKEGNNSETSNILSQKNIPLILTTARPDWPDSADKEMEGLGLKPADVIITGAGTLIYWRDEEDNLIRDPIFLNKINPFNEDPKKKLVVNVVGDAAIDDWMNAMGTGLRDPYSVNGISLGNRTPIAQAHMEQVSSSLKKHPHPDWRQAHLKLIEETGPKGILQIVNEF